MKNSLPKPGEKLVHVDGTIFHIFPGKHDGMDSVIPIRWCTCPAEIQKLKKLGARNLHMLLVTKAADNGPEERWIIPLKKEMAYITLRRPGKNYLFATIIGCEDYEVKKMKQNLSAQHRRGVYEKHVLEASYGKNEEDGFHNKKNIFNGYPCTCQSYGKESLEFEVAGEFFAKEPPEWLKSWANLYYSTSPIDECDFRKRCIIAFFTSPFMLIYITIIFFIRLAIAAFYLFLGKSLPLSPIVHPFRDDNYDMYRYTKPSIFADGFKWMFTPLVWTIVIAISLLVKLKIWLEGPDLYIPFWEHFGTMPWGNFLLLSVICSIAFGIIILITEILFIYAVCGIAWLGGKLKNSEKAKEKAQSFGAWLGKKWDERRERLKAEAKAAREIELEQEYQAYEEIACPGVAREASIAALPKKRRTISLRFHALKRRVCKPFAQ